MGTEALEKIFLYWLCHLPDAGALQIRRIGEAAGGFQQAYYIEDVFTPSPAPSLSTMKPG